MFLTATCLMSLIGSLASTEKMVPEGRLDMRPFQFHLKEHWKFPQPLDSLLPWTEAIFAHLVWWQNPANVMKGSHLHPKDHSIQLLTRRLKQRLGRSLRTKFYTSSVVSPGKRASHKHPRNKSCLSGPETLQRPVSGPNRASCDGQLNCGGLHKQQGEHNQRRCVHSCGESWPGDIILTSY